MRSALVLVAGVLFLASCQPPSLRVRDAEQIRPGERMVLRFSHVTAEDTPKGLAARRFAERVRELSGGRIEVQVFANSTLYRDGDEFDALQQGKVHFLAPSLNKLVATAPLFQVLDLPFLFSDEASILPAIGGKAEPQFQAALRPQNMVHLDTWFNGFVHFYSAVRPVRVPQDLAGLRFRAQSPSRAAMYRPFGAEPRVMPFVDFVRAAFERRSVDTSENTVNNILTSRTYEVMPHLTATSHNYDLYIVLTQNQWWQGVAEADRGLLMRALASASAWERENASQLQRESMAKLRNSGLVQAHELNPQERDQWLRAFEPVYGAAEKVAGHKLMAHLRQVTSRR